MPRLLAALLVVASASVATAAPTVTCHCFTDRSFDPDRPAAADVYILANIRSSLLSAVFGVSKASLVRATMGGTAPEDLWIAHWTAYRTDRDAAALLSESSRPGSWRAALSGAKGLPPAFEAALARGARPSELAALAVDDVLARKLDADPAAVRALRDAGASTEQVVAAVFLARRLDAPAIDVLARIRDGRATWGTLLKAAGLAPEGIEAQVRADVAAGGRAAATP